jgi:NADPH2 dehydrogenase
VDLGETHDFLDAIEAMEIELVCTTAGSPYYNPHIQRPAFFAPSDGYKPPEDPLVGVARQIQATAQLRARHPKLVFVGSGYSYLQEWLPNVAQYVVREGLCDVVGIGGCYPIYAFYKERPEAAQLAAIKKANSG